jgi:hypothetical protein
LSTSISGDAVNVVYSREMALGLRRLGVIVVLATACKSGDRPAASPAPAASGAAPAEPVAAPSAPTPRPELPTISDAGPAPVTAAQDFEAEAVDRAWRDVTEDVVRGNLAHVHAGPARVACRRITCEVTLQGTMAELGAARHDLETMLPTAFSVLLTAPEPTKDKDRLSLRAYVRFERPEPP